MAARCVDLDAPPPAGTGGPAPAEKIVRLARGRGARRALILVRVAKANIPHSRPARSRPISPAAQAGVHAGEVQLVTCSNLKRRPGLGGPTARAPAGLGLTDPEAGLWSLEPESGPRSGIPPPPGPGPPELLPAGWARQSPGPSPSVATTATSTSSGRAVGSCGTIGRTSLGIPTNGHVQVTHGGSTNTARAPVPSH